MITNVASRRETLLIQGTLYVFPRPAPKHSSAHSSLWIQLGPPFRLGEGGPGGWWLLDEPELHLGDDPLVPDLAGWRVERMPDLPEIPCFPPAPDLGRTFRGGAADVGRARRGASPGGWYAACSLDRLA